jgi:lysophospholipase L1-like esterase
VARRRAFVPSLTGVGRGIRATWLFLGVTVALVAAADGLLQAFVPDPLQATQIDPRARKPAKRKSDVFLGMAWAPKYWREYSESRNLRWDHYGLWRRKQYQGEHITIDERGLRDTWNPPPTKGALRIFVFGGSAVWGTGARDGYTLPSQLSRILNAEGIEAQVVNFGEAGYVSSQDLLALERELRRGNVPDLALFYGGANDVAAAIQWGQAGIPLNEVSRVREFNLTHRYWKLLRALGTELRGVRRLREYLTVELSGSPQDPPELFRELVTRYEWNVDSIRWLGERHGFFPRFYWQPAVFTKRNLSSKEILSRDSRQHRHRALHLDAHRVVASSDRLAGASDVVDLYHLLDDVEGPLYMDYIHISEKGNEIVARAIADDLIAMPEHRRMGAPLFYVR